MTATLTSNEEIINHVYRQLVVLSRLFLLEGNADDNLGEQETDLHLGAGEHLRDLCELLDAGRTSRFMWRPGNPRRAGEKAVPHDDSVRYAV